MQDSDAPQNNDIKKWMGKADWIWNEELELHLPSCIVVVEGFLMGVKAVYRCGNGPLTTPEQIASGNCGEH